MKKYTILAVALLIAASAVNAFSVSNAGPGQLASTRVLNGGRAYEINQETQNIDVYENDDLAGSIDLSPNSPVALAITPDGNTLYVACRENIVHIIDASTNTITGVIINPRIQDPVNLVMANNGARVSVINQSGSTVTIDTATNTVIE